MSASAPRNTDRDDFARGFARFARALCAGEDARRRAGVCSAVTAALKEALATDAWSRADWTASASRATPAARIAIYRSLVGAFLRNCGPRAPLSPAFARGQLRHSGAGPLAQSATVTEAGRAAAALGRLEPMERAALLLVAVERLSYRDAAHALDVDEHDLIATLARAREAFSALLAASGAAGAPHLRLVK
jgi:DNA-directed RNA polymerase specialized sigma24 family protein